MTSADVSYYGDDYPEHDEDWCGVHAVARGQCRCPWDSHTPRETRDTREMGAGQQPDPTPDAPDGAKRPQQANGPWWASAITADALDAVEYPPVTYLVDALLPAGGIVLLAGAPKSGKSMLAVGCAYAVATGTKALNGADVPTAGGVLVVSLDDQSRARAQRRLRQVARGAALPAALTLHTEPNLGQGKDAARNLDHYLTQHPATALVVLDTLEHLRRDKQAGESVYTADVRFLAQVRWVADRHPHVTFLCLTHTRKPDGDGDQDPITAVGGTHGVTGGADHVLVLTGRRGVPRRVLDIITRDGDDSRRVLTFTDNGLELTDEDPDDPKLMLSDDDAAVWEALAACGDQGATAGDLEPDCEGVNNIGNRLASLTKKGYAKRLGRGRYASTR